MIHHPTTTTSPQKHHEESLNLSKTPNKNALPPQNKKSGSAKSRTA
jgi:hypothetical protein